MLTGQQDCSSKLKKEWVGFLALSRVGGLIRIRISVSVSGIHWIKSKYDVPWDIFIKVYKVVGWSNCEFKFIFTSQKISSILCTIASCYRGSCIFIQFV